MSHYHLTPQASQDLDDISDYVAQTNPAAARRLIDAIERQCERLAKFPGMGRQRDDLGSGLYSFPVRKYIIVYRQVDDGIEVIRVVHGARDLPSLFQTP
jgi:toxin ParE1/3/4